MISKYSKVTLFIGGRTQGIDACVITLRVSRIRDLSQEVFVIPHQIFAIKGLDWNNLLNLKSYGNFQLCSEP